MTDRKLVKCVVGGSCMESYPCQHKCQLRWSDGTRSESSLNGWSAVSNTYWNLLDKENQSHFSYMIDLIKSESPEEQVQYSDFLASF